MPSVLITGASRGLGLEFTRQYAADGWRVYACCRNPHRADALNALAGDAVTVHALDVDELPSARGCANELAGVPIDVLINNAGVMGQRVASMDETDYDAWLACLNTNILGPMRVSAAFRANLLAGDEKKLVVISSRMGSIGSLQGPGQFVYRSSKAGVNMVMKSMSFELAEEGVITMAFHPGWVQTDMGGANADLTAKDSVRQMRGVIAGLTPADNGSFKNYDGAPIVW